jgi:hypothetical protein
MGVGNHRLLTGALSVGWNASGALERGQPLTRFALHLGQLLGRQGHGGMLTRSVGESSLSDFSEKNLGRWTRCINERPPARRVDRWRWASHNHGIAPSHTVGCKYRSCWTNLLI